MAEQLLKKEKSTEEKRYQEAVELQESASCIVRYEEKVTALESAARKFEKLGNYQDAAERMAASRKAAQEAEDTGCRETFLLAQKKEREAATKGGFMDAVFEYRRLKKNPEYAEQAKKQIAFCKQQIAHLEKKRAWKRRLITFAVLVICLLGFTKTEGYTFVKGMVYQQKGQYRAALQNYKVSQSIPGVNKKIRACYYYLGEKSLENGKRKRALKQFTKAETYEDAAAKKTALEKEFLAEAQLGDCLSFGNRKWIVAEKKKDSIFLICNKLDKKMIYSSKENVTWEESDIYHWLNTTFLSKNFSDEERAEMILPEDSVSETGESNTGYAFLVSRSEYENYQDYLPLKSADWWLRTDKVSSGAVVYVAVDGTVKNTFAGNDTCHVRAAIQVRIE